LLCREKVFAFLTEGTRYDCGSKQVFWQASLDLGLQHGDVGAEFTDWL
jgi:UTP--glucose-1-phosphate uridylyltransferase